MIQYWMKILPFAPSFAKMNCSQPLQTEGSAEPMQTELVKKFVLSWSVYALVMSLPVLLIFPLSVMPAETLSNEPMAVEIVPLGACGDTSLPLPTVIGLGPCFGNCG